MGPIYTVLNIFSCIELIILAYISKKNKHSQYRLIGYLCFGSLITTLVAGATIYPINKIYIKFMHGLYLSCTSWVILTLYKFILTYSGKKDDYLKPKYIRYTVAFIDTVLLLSNVFTSYSFDINIISSTSYRVIPEILYNVHYIYIYYYIALIVYRMIKLVINNVSVYRTKYILMLNTFFIIIGLALLEGLGLLHHMYSVLGYSLMIFIIYKFTSKYVPRTVSKYVKSIVVDNGAEGIICFDKNNNFTYANKIGIEYLKNRGKDSNYSITAETLHREYDEIYNFKENKDISFDITKNRRNYKIKIETYFEKKDVFVASCVIIHDATEELRAQKNELRKVSHDSLTKLYNREYIQNKLPDLLKENLDKNYYVVFSDIKNFKIINDYYGPQTGDKILKTLASILDKTFKNERDVLYGRIASDNFVIILPVEKYNKYNIKKLLDRVNKILKLDMKLYIYLGIYKVTDINMNSSLMIDHALMALKKVKKSYKEFVGFYDETYKDSILKEQKMVSDLPQALKNKEFKMYLQPQISSDNKVIGAEALVRWEKDGRIISPAEFIKVYESTGLIYKVDTYIWECAVEKIAEWEKKGIKDLYISINISPEDFHSIDVVKTITKLVNKHNINKDRLKLEITESIFIDEASDVIKLIDDLRGHGFKVEMDDFGSGYSSLNQLKNINVDVVKMDMGFLYDVDNLNKSNAILSALIDLSKTLGYEVITEGVETKDQFEYLSNIGCDVFQGYFIDKPMKIEDFESKYMEEI